MAPPPGPLQTTPGPPPRPPPPDPPGPPLPDPSQTIPGSRTTPWIYPIICPITSTPSPSTSTSTSSSTPSPSSSTSSSSSVISVIRPRSLCPVPPCRGAAHRECSTVTGGVHGGGCTPGGVHGGYAHPGTPTRVHHLGTHHRAPHRGHTADTGCLRCLNAYARVARCDI